MKRIVSECKKHGYLIVIFAVIFLALIVFRIRSVPEKIAPDHIHLTSFMSDGKDLYEKRFYDDGPLIRYEVIEAGGDKAEQFWKHTDLQIDSIKKWTDGAENQSQDVLIFNNKDGIMLENIVSDVFVGDIDGDKKDELVLVSSEGSGLQRLCIYMLSVNRNEIQVTDKIHIMRHVNELIADNSRLWISKGIVKNNEIEIEVEDKKIKLLYKSGEDVTATMDQKDVELIKESSIKVENISETYKKSFEDNIYIDK